MPIFQLNKLLQFPHPQYAEPDGLLAIDGDLEPERILLAYRNGIFPWYSGKQILWWSPDPRFVLFPNQLRIHKSMRPLFNRNAFEITYNESFEEVMQLCGTTKRQGQKGTWIHKDMLNAYTKLHHLGYAHSVESRVHGKLVGGLYGLKIGRVFFGESMFSKTPNASKYAFITWVERLKLEGVALIDCQVQTDHLASLGAIEIPRTEFLMLLENLVTQSHIE